MILNYTIIITKNEIGKNNPKPSLGVYSQRRIKEENIFSIYSNFIIVEDLRYKMKYFKIAKIYQMLIKIFKKSLYIKRFVIKQSCFCFSRVSYLIRIRRELNSFQTYTNLY